MSTEKAKAEAKKYYRKNRIAIRAKQLRRQRTEAAKQARRKGLYGLTPVEHADLVARQKGLCAICNEPKDLCIDHDHKTGQVRGLLCTNCNLGIGNLKDDPEILRKAIAYLT
jgi:hypothetical protein